MVYQPDGQGISCAVQMAEVSQHGGPDSEQGSISHGFVSQEEHPASEGPLARIASEELPKADMRMESKARGC